MTALTAPDLSPMIEVLQTLQPQSDRVVNFFAQHLQQIHPPKGTLLLKTGEVNKQIYFIRYGIVRGFITDAGKDITTWISCENEFVTSISGLIDRTAALENIETVEDCCLYCMPVAALEQLYETCPEFNATSRILFQRYYADAERRALIARLAGAEDRYRFFLHFYAHLANRIPLKLIASFLGITIETLSRVRKKLSIQY